MINGKTITALIQARVSSSRLPMKHFRRIGERAVMEWILWRLATITGIDQIVVSTTKEPDSDLYCQYRNNYTYDVFEYTGDVNDVAGRHYAATLMYPSDYYLVISGDCPLIDQGYIEGLLGAVALDNWTAVFGEHSINEGMQLHSMACMKYIEQNSITPDQRENFGYKVDYDPDQIKLIKIEEKYRENLCRISVDNMADLRFMNHLEKLCNDKSVEYNLSNVVDFLSQDVHLLQLHGHVRQKQVGHNTKRFVFLTESSKLVGLGHLARMIAFAQELNEAYHHGIKFLINNDALAIDRLQNEGYIYDYQVYSKDDLVAIIKEINADIIIADFADPAVYFELLSSTGKRIVYYDKLNTSYVQNFNVLQGVQPEQILSAQNNKTFSGFGTVFINKKLEYLLRIARNKIPGIYISFGASDPEDYLPRALALLPKNIPIYVKQGIYAKPLGTTNSNVVLIAEEDNYKYIASCEIAVCAYGVTFYELLFAGAKVLCIGRSKTDCQILDLLERNSYCKQVVNIEDISDLGVLFQIDGFVDPRQYFSLRDEFINSFISLI